MRLLNLNLINFQTHKKLGIDLNYPIVTLKGPTDSGKSAVLRALGWTALNNLSGEEFIKEGEKETEVTLVVIAGNVKHRITRSKGKKNLYTLDGEDYQAFAQSVPSSIAATLQMNGINFQFQHDAPFWFSESAPEVSRQLNSVIDLSIIDTTLSNIGQTVRQSAERVSLTEERLATAKAELERLAVQEKRCDEFADLKTLYDNQNDLATDSDRLGAIIAQIDSNQAKTLARQAEEGAAVLVAMLEARKLLHLASVLQETIKEAAHHQAASTPPPSFAAVKQAHDAWVDAREGFQSLESIVTATVAAQDRVTRNVGKIKNAQKWFNDGVKDKRCSLCNQVLK